VKTLYNGKSLDQLTIIAARAYVDYKANCGLYVAGSVLQRPHDRAIIRAMTKAIAEAITEQK
jgi:hypothetical protein